jgi:hypothetical protein
MLCFAMTAAMLTACNENPDDKEKEGEVNIAEPSVAADSIRVSCFTATSTIIDSVFLMIEDKAQILWRQKQHIIVQVSR